MYLLLYVDDIVLTASSALLRRTIQALQQEFSMKDLGELHHFLGMHVQRCPNGLLLSQRQYIERALRLISHFGLSGVQVQSQRPQHRCFDCGPRVRQPYVAGLGLVLAVSSCSFPVLGSLSNKGVD